MDQKFKWGALALGLLLGLGTWQIGCDDDDTGDSDSDSDGDSDSDSDGDSDSDSDGDSDGDCTPISWGPASGTTVGGIVGNWSMNGFFDENGDGTLSSDEQVDTTFTMEDLHCYAEEYGAQSLIVYLTDTS